jgi:hypothetical protein
LLASCHLPPECLATPCPQRLNAHWAWRKGNGSYAHCLRGGPTCTLRAAEHRLFALGRNAPCSH